jgi:hypothetical protein
VQCTRTVSALIKEPRVCGFTAQGFFFLIFYVALKDSEGAVQGTVSALIEEPRGYGFTVIFSDFSMLL